MSQTKREPLKLVTLDHLSILAKEMKGEYATKPVPSAKKEVVPAENIQFTCEFTCETTDTNDDESPVDGTDIANDDDIRKMFHDS